MRPNLKLRRRGHMATSYPVEQPDRAPVSVAVNGYASTTSAAPAPAPARTRAPERAPRPEPEPRAYERVKLLLDHEPGIGQHWSAFARVRLRAEWPTLWRVSKGPEDFARYWRGCLWPSSMRRSVTSGQTWPRFALSLRCSSARTCYPRPDAGRGGSTWGLCPLPPLTVTASPGPRSRDTPASPRRHSPRTFGVESPCRPH